MIFGKGEMVLYDILMWNYFLLKLFLYHQLVLINSTFASGGKELLFMK